MRKTLVKTTLIAILLCGIAFAGTYPPGLSYSSVLNGVLLQSKNGQFRLNAIQGTFFPPNVEGWTILKKAGGGDIYRIEFKTQTLKAPYFYMDFWKTTDLRTNKNLGAGWFSLTETGDYVLDFYLPTGKFHTFPFSVSKLSAGDPFAGGDYYFLEGDWADWGYLYYRGAKPDQNLQWKVWLRNKAAENYRDAKVRVEIVRDRDKKLICTSRENTTYSLNPKWVRYAFDMVFPPEQTSYGKYFKAKDLLAVDGAYTLKMTVNGKHYGTWKFSIKGGKPQYTGRTLRGKADPLTFVEGGLDAFWYKKQ